MTTWTIWTEITQRRVYHPTWGWGTATAESNTGLLSVHFDADPWFPKRVKVEEVE